MWQNFIQKQSLKHGLPHSVAILSASIGFVYGMDAGCLFGSLCADFAPDKKLGCLVVGGGVASGAVGALATYCGAFGTANLFLWAYPSLQNTQVPLFINHRRINIVVFVVCTSLFGVRHLNKLGILTQKSLQ